MSIKNYRKLMHLVIVFNIILLLILIYSSTKYTKYNEREPHHQRLIIAKAQPEPTQPQGRILASYPITIITCYFPIKKSKHGPKKYQSWMSNFLSKIETPILIYTDNSTTSFLSKLRNRNKNGGHIIPFPMDIQIYESIWDLPPMRNLHQNYQDQQLNMDPEKKIHSPELYAIWNSKSWMVSHAAISLNPFNSTYFYWVDIGSFRDSKHSFRIWPDLEKVEKVFDDSNAKFPHLFAVQEFSDDLRIRIDRDPSSYQVLARKGGNHIIGGFFGGRAEALKRWSDLFYETHDSMLKRNYFVGKDQHLMNWIALNYKNELLVTCTCDQRGFRFDYCGDEWFYFQQWYASDQERKPTCDGNAQLRNMTTFINKNKNKNLPT